MEDAGRMIGLGEVQHAGAEGWKAGWAQEPGDPADLWGSNEGSGLSRGGEHDWGCGPVGLKLLSLHWPSCRQTGLGLVGIPSRIGGILTPFVIMLDEYHAAAPMLIYGILPIGAGLLCALLPETRGQSLKDTIHDLEQKSYPR